MLLLPFFLQNCQKEKIDAKYVVKKFKEHADKIDKISYNVRRIDSFASGNIWDKAGTVLVETDKQDKLHGFSFFAKRNNADNEILYVQNNAFEINPNKKNFREAHPGGVIGYPTGQLVVTNIFNLPKTYKELTLTETNDRFILLYQFKKDTLYDIETQKTVELTKNNYFPIKFITSKKKSGKKHWTTYHELSNIKTNSDVTGSIKSYKDGLLDLEFIPAKKREPNKLLGKKLPAIELPNLFDKNKSVALSYNKLTLLDFWEVWCGPCIRSFPKVADLSHKYSKNLQVVGMVSKDIETAQKVARNKGATFTNLVGNDKLLKELNVNSFPRFFLIDQKGILLKEYGGANSVGDIEKDIQEILSKK